MRNSVIITALAGLASVSTGQSVAIEFIADRTRLHDSSHSVHWTMQVSFTGYDDPTAYFGGFRGTIFEARWNKMEISNLKTYTGSAVEPDYQSDGSFFLTAFNSVILGTNDTSNPYTVLEFDALYRAGDYFPYLAYTATGTVYVYPTDNLLEIADEFTEFTVTSTRVETFFVPAPAGTCALLGVVATRRRRR